MRLSWRPAAEADRLAIYDHIEADNPQAAELVDERILARVLTLLQLPQSGRPGRVEGTRELTIRRTPYFVIYRIEDDTVRILRILHSAREWSADVVDER
ncbi:type II toxin-antitoxin system RelE/ParE family toxin [Mycobacterium sp. KBS0706]|uniref:type II toxin-antitoxin system RelE/ParE family toxin n=1 Tax=Mycobacterium sp. KBS0706 TaxID=2578109 RepID=UPI00110FC19C|nr:type II toxin-antitoxin system RelE/ParE family toxin [Mycobacterium sp. KBS0706]TSD87792.1 type II toxin-antitoxin system RelE/ParE family toxin [Mycobacterium sp. KBS0706]